MTLNDSLEIWNILYNKKIIYRFQTSKWGKVGLATSLLMYQGAGKEKLGEKSMENKIHKII